MKELVHYIQNNINNVGKSIVDTYSLAFEAHYQLVTIHPFSDGNGRTSRLVMNYIQHYHNYPMTIVFEEDKGKYYKALVQTRKEENLDIFKEFMFTQANKYFLREIESLEQKPKIKKRNGMSFLF